ncbi:hypothetical protein GGU11DRAFT_750650 [Lentinula aff. detonsa]|uniref:Zn(2)-C6 fungal-type domain-containing protein n=1 Tax=Lentinula detonsa TaxID=2804962 RepID=A0AA38PME1_9AGAR|nr:hypothetical protein GGU11DRAFT_750650 [Lentinula aff. detonsa]KAJ3978259.1 hypothetical protein F5890DRAFT_1560702 [Lentinula detonsa]
MTLPQLAGTPGSTGPAQKEGTGSGNETEERDAVLQQLFWLDRRKEEKKARKTAAAEKRVRDERAQQNARGELEPEPPVGPLVSNTRDSISGYQPDVRGEGPSNKRSHSNGPGFNLPEGVVSKKAKQPDSINVQVIEDSDSDNVGLREPCDNCHKKDLPCRPQRQGRPGSACEYCKRGKLRCTWLHPKRAPRAQAFAPDYSQLIAEHLNTIVAQNYHVTEYLTTIVAQNHHVTAQNDMIIQHLKTIGDSFNVQQPLSNPMNWWA